MKDSQQMSVDISSQNDMALKALPPVSLKDSNIYPVGSMVSDDLGDDSFRLQLIEDEDDQRNAIKNSNIVEVTQETEDDILNKFDTPEVEGVTVTNGCLESDELEEKLLNDVIDNNEAKNVENGECTNSNEEVNNSDSDLRNKKSDSVFSDNEEAAKDKNESQDEETAADKALNATEEKEKANAVLLKDQIMDTEDLLQIVDQQDSEEINDNSNSGENTPDKDDSDEAEMESNGVETDKNEDDEDNQVSKNDDDCVDIDEETSFRNEFDSELDQEYQKIVDEKENESSSDEPSKEKGGEVEGDEETAVPEKMDVDECGNVVTQENEVENEITTAIVDKGAISSTDVTSDPDATSDPNPTSDPDVITHSDIATDRDPTSDPDVTTDSGTTTDPIVTADPEPTPDSDATADADVVVTDANDTSNGDATTEMEIAVEKDVDSNKDTNTDLEVTDLEVDESNMNEEVDDKASGIETDTESNDASRQNDSNTANKRSLSETDLASDPKRLRLEEPVVNEENSTTKNDEPVKATEKTTPILALNLISEYMQKKNSKKLTRQDLEQMCLMKMCEAICHKSEIGELRHQLGVQEQMIDMWRKEAAQLTKQARDLEIVNKRLLHEVRLKNDRDKPLIPVKITRSVGLQVRSDNNVMNNVVGQKRRFTRPQPATATTPSKPTTTAPSTPSKPNTTTPTPQKQQTRYTQNKPVTPSPINKPLQPKVITSSPVTKPPTPIKPKTIATKSPSSLLSKALQNSAAQVSNPTTGITSINNTATPPLASITTTPTTTTSPVTSKPNLTPKPTKTTPDSKTFIDLTDEDEKKPTLATTTTSTTTTTVNGATTPGVRILPTTVRNNSVSSTGVVNPPRIMYVYNNQLHQGVLATDSQKIGPQKLMLKLNANVVSQANGVLTAVTNGSTIAVSNAAIRTNQVQPVRLSTPVTSVRTSPTVKPIVKHPAPLPPPPMAQMGLAARKSIPPKPHLSIRRSSGGIVLSWKMPYNLDNYEAIASYQLYAYQETTSPPSSEMWRKVGDVKALALPMACTLTQFADGNKYHFAVRAVDVQKRMGPFSDPEQILL